MSIFDKFGRQTSNEPGSAEKAEMTARQQARVKVQGLVRMMRFQSYVKNGMSADQAAQAMGIKVKPMDRYNTAKILEKVEKGE